MAYDRSFADVYDRFGDTSDYRARAAYQLGLLRSYGIEDGLLLDAACGTGTLTAYYLKAGYDVVAADASAEMLMRAREKLAPWADHLLLLCQRLETLDLYGTVRAAVCSLDSVNHLLDEDALLAAFRKINLFTEPGGIFIFDVNTVYKHREILGSNTFVFEDESAYLVWRNDYDETDNSVDMLFDMFLLQPDGRYLRTEDDNTERAYSPEVLSALLQHAGFRGVRIYADLSLDPPGAFDERLCFVAEK